MARGYFVTGTDTGVGKTLVSAALLHQFNQQGLKTVAMKPVASGCMQGPEGLRNEDALLLQQTASIALDYNEVNPYAFEPAIAPHLAARQVNEVIDVKQIKQGFNKLASKGDAVIVEGVGGWHVPLNDKDSTVDVARAVNLPVVMVVAMRLGCLNHALLTAEAIGNDGLSLAGWVANSIDNEMTSLDENIETLKDAISAPFLGYIPFGDPSNIEKISKHITLL